MAMLWFNFILGLNFILLCVKLIIIYYHTPTQKKLKFKPATKLNHNSHNYYGPKIITIKFIISVVTVYFLFRDLSTGVVFHPDRWQPIIVPPIPISII